MLAGIIRFFILSSKSKNL